MRLITLSLMTALLLPLAAQAQDQVPQAPAENQHLVQIQPPTLPTPTSTSALPVKQAPVAVAADNAYVVTFKGPNGRSARSTVLTASNVPQSSSLAGTGLAFTLTASADDQATVHYRFVSVSSPVHAEDTTQLAVGQSKTVALSDGSSVTITRRMAAAPPQQQVAPPASPTVTDPSSLRPPTPTPGQS